MMKSVIQVSVTRGYCSTKPRNMWAVFEDGRRFIYQKLRFIFNDKLEVWKRFYAGNLGVNRLHKSKFK